MSGPYGVGASKPNMHKNGVVLKFRIKINIGGDQYTKIK